jgi:NADPH:quinone reductase-like Zn-dependent oxidoreductase
MKVIYIKECGGPDVLTYGDFPDPKPGPQDVIVRVRASALNRIDIFARSGARSLLSSFPRILGLDMAGEIVEIGPNVVGWKSGERVLIDYCVKCGVCDYCDIGQDDQCRETISLGLDADGGYAQYVRVPAVNCYAIPKWMSFEEAAAIPVVSHTALHCLVTRAKVRPGETVLVNSAGSGVGTAAVQIARILGAKVLTIAGNDQKTAYAKTLGAEDGVNYNARPDFDKAILLMTNGEGVDVVLDTVGATFWDQSISCLKYGGRLVNSGLIGGSVATLNIADLASRGISIIGTGNRNRKEFADMMKMARRGNLRGIIGKVFPLQDAPQAHRLMESREFIGKIVLQIP